MAVQAIVFLLHLFIGFSMGIETQVEGRSNYLKCVEEIRSFSTKCKTFLKDNQDKANLNVCEKHARNMMLKCQNIRTSEECQGCFQKLEKVVDKCVQFYQPVQPAEEEVPRQCMDLKNELTESCSTKCPVCQDKLCQNGGQCSGGDLIFSCRCLPQFKGIYCETSRCSISCQNGGVCSGENQCTCLWPFTGSYCQRKRLGTKDNPGVSGSEIIKAGDSLGNGMYWIRPYGELQAARTYCDMEFDGGGWMLASYGYLDVHDDDPRNKVMLNLNYPYGYLWLPEQRSSSHGVISLSRGAVLLARSSRYMIMAAGNNPDTGGINEYRYVFKIDLSNISSNISFDNHNSHHGSSGSQNIPQMHLERFIVQGLKGELGQYTRFSLAESLGVTSRDSSPAGYGFYSKKEQCSFFNDGPFFPSVHSGSGRKNGCHYGKRANFPPDVLQGCYSYNDKGWYTATSVNNFGQMSIWFK